MDGTPETPGPSLNKSMMMSFAKTGNRGEDQVSAAWGYIMKSMVTEGLQGWAVRDTKGTWVPRVEVWAADGMWKPGAWRRWTETMGLCEGASAEGKGRKRAWTSPKPHTSSMEEDWPAQETVKESPGSRKGPWPRDA